MQFRFRTRVLSIHKAPATARRDRRFGESPASRGLLAGANRWLAESSGSFEPSDAQMKRGFFDKPTSGPNVTSFCAVDRNLPKDVFREEKSLQGVAHAALSVAPFDASRLPRAFRDGSIYVKSADGIEENLLLMLHGRGDCPKPYAQLARKMELPQTSALAIPGPLPVPFTDNGRAWFQAFDDDFGLIPPEELETRRTSSLEVTISDLEELVDCLHSALGWPYERIHLFGFSDGGSVALELTLRLAAKSIRLGGAIAVSASILPEVLRHRKRRAQPQLPAPHTPVLITHGEEDEIVPRSDVHDTLELLNQQLPGSRAYLFSVKGKGHGMVGGPNEMKELMTFWSLTLARRVPVTLGPGETLVEIKGGWRPPAGAGGGVGGGAAQPVPGR